MTKLLLPTLLYLLLAGGLSAQDTATGTVYADTNGNGTRDAGEKGIAAVSVTNGERVVRTDAAGRYTLPIGDDHIVSVIKPAGYAVPTDANNLPRFYYIHKPAGSPSSDFAGVAATGPLPDAIDFGLVPREEPEQFTALIFGDPQPYTLEEVDFFARGVVAEVEGIENIPFGLSLGDLVGNDLDLFNPYIQAVKRVGIPWYNVMGNHDLNFDAPTDQLADETYEAHFGPANYAFNYGKVHFIVLDNILYPDPRDSSGYWGGYREDQLDFVENDLRFVPEDHLVVLAHHIPLDEFGGETYRDEDRARLFDILADHPHTLSLSAHTHTQRQDYFGAEEGWRGDSVHHEYNVGTTSGDWYSGRLDDRGIPVSTMRDGTPKGYAFLHFDGNQYRTEYRVAGKPATYQMELFHPRVIARGRNTQAGIYANFFVGREGDEVVYRVDDGAWQAMEYVEEQDPSYEASVYEWDTAEELLPGRRGSNAVPSTHLWRGNIPAKLAAGEHTIEVRATDQFGQVHTGKSAYRVEAVREAGR
ncbi:calcineurin-like phosphoesterase family protein [Neolewinella xylanilytica]|uniref:Calcineurin-like phosphoesterase family protein n=1 Tax=Neolewinella xylanilytica TaxID=1514080 RepID=A0A2S6I8M7_9BACT|nr:calcineurin-like phosphoesterase family protein [Neolewinella xylanilytica]PPK87850.1 calcineurin-like phosphoesterase family protein [Neolewinella xylanilytica]